MQVVCLTHMTFAGKQRKPGETISMKDWMTASDRARAALVNQGMMRVGGGERQEHRAAVQESGEYSTDAIELLQGISAKLDRLLTRDGIDVLAEDDPAPVVTAARAPAKKAKARKAKRRKVKKPAAPAAVEQD